MEYNDFKTDFIKQNNILKVTLGIIVVLFIMVVLGFYFEKRYYIFKGGFLFQERPLVEEVCREGFESLTEGDPNPYLVSKGIRDIVAKEPFEIHVDKLLQVKSLESGACKIILMSQGKMMAFKVIMLASDDNPFYYLINQLDELAVDKEDE